MPGFTYVGDRSETGVSLFISDIFTGTHAVCLGLSTAIRKRHADDPGPFMRCTTVGSHQPRLRLEKQRSREFPPCVCVWQPHQFRVVEGSLERESQREFISVFACKRPDYSTWSGRRSSTSAAKMRHVRNAGPAVTRPYIRSVRRVLQAARPVRPGAVWSVIKAPSFNR